MKLTVILMLILAGLFYAEIGDANECDGYPSNKNAPADSVMLFEHDNYRGNCYMMYVGKTRLAPNDVFWGFADGFKHMEDEVSSIKVGGDAKVYVCSDGGLKGNCEWIGTDDPNLKNNKIGGDKISSLIVRSSAFDHSCKPGPDEVAFYEHDTYRGYCSVKQYGDYSVPGYLYIANDSISSIRVGKNAQVCVFKHSSFAGAFEIINIDDPNLSNNKVGTDTISSAIVQKKGDKCS